MTSKAELIHRIRSKLADRLKRLEQAAREAHAAATDPDAKAESKYDTRGLEASYLAAGQAKQAEALVEAIQSLETVSFPDFSPDTPIGAGALVELIGDDGPTWFLLAPAAGGLEFEFEDAPLTVLTPESCLYTTLLGLHLGDTLDTPPTTITEIR